MGESGLYDQLLVFSWHLTSLKVNEELGPLRSLKESGKGRNTFLRISKAINELNFNWTITPISLKAGPKIIRTITASIYHINQIFENNNVIKPIY